MSLVSRVGDTTVGMCCAHTGCIGVSGFIAAGAATVTAAGLPVAQLNSTVIAACGHTAMVATASLTVTANGLPVARLGDSHVGVFTGTIAAGAPTVTSGSSH